MRLILTAVAFLLGSALCEPASAQQEAVGGRATVSATVVPSGVAIAANGDLKSTATPIRFCVEAERRVAAKKIDSCFAVTEAGRTDGPRQLVGYELRDDGPAKVLVLTY